MNNQQKRKAAYERLWLDELMAYADQSSILHSWEPLEYLDKGQFSRIFKIRHYTTGMLGALKFVPNPVELSDCAAEGSSQNAFHRSRFEASKREVEIMARFSGESNIVQHLERPEFLQRVFLDENGRKVVQYAVLICMPLYHSSKEWLPLCTENVNLRFQLALDMAHALTVFEQKGVYHRDIKPGNIMMDDYGVFYLSDVGEAKLENDHTTIGFHGTRPYMAPEVWRLENERGKAHSDHRSDIYSLGIVLYRLFNHHQFPFLTEEGSLTEDATRSYERYEKRNKSADPALLLPDTERARLLRYEGLALPAPSEADKELGRIILKACAYNLKDRYQTAAELQADLKNYLEKPVRVPGKASHAPKREKRLKALLGVCAAGLVGVIAFCAYQLGQNSAVRPEAALPVALTSSAPEAAVSPVPAPEATPTYTAALEPDPTPTTTPTASPVATSTPTPTPSHTPTPTLTPVPTPSPTPTPILTSEGLTLEFAEDGNWAVTQYSGDSPILAIPVAVQGRNITQVEDRAFFECSTLQKVIFSKGIKKIGNEAFSECKNLQEIVLPEGIEEIGNKAFYKCPNLTEIVLPASLTNIGNDAFYRALESYSVSWEYYTRELPIELYVVRNTYAANYAQAYHSHDPVRYYKPGSNISTLDVENYFINGATLKSAKIVWIDSGDIKAGIAYNKADYSIYKPMSQKKLSQMVKFRLGDSETSPKRTPLACRMEIAYAEKTPNKKTNALWILRSPSGRLACDLNVVHLTGGNATWTECKYLNQMLRDLTEDFWLEEIGTYTIELYFDGQYIGSTSFEVTL